VRGKVPRTNNFSTEFTRRPDSIGTAFLLPDGTKEQMKNDLKFGVGIVNKLKEKVVRQRSSSPTQIVIAELSWRKRWLTKARRETLKGIIEYANRYLKPVGGSAVLKIEKRGAVFKFSNPWHLISLSHQRLEQWAGQEGQKGCTYQDIELI